MKKDKEEKANEGKKVSRRDFNLKSLWPRFFTSHLKDLRKSIF
jgi:hypothetical protein